ncbi:pyridoxal-phosphate dependent enzyme [Sanyastnella coralliicola]|uniref:pyridoxal-phosphate dependent enzyme n=1 Tax=Sanyastnella coralliicola TaxID=3069118 RepID=UPI0027BA823B|nr:pyridoxal-phosphate dependent enzyme [Longitalea sp. SCSIO 12813]
MSKRVYNNIIEAIGDTPMIRLNEIAKDIPAKVFAKVEYFNPGNSVKDRMALKMIEDAEKSGALKPGGTVIECTSGNTGMGLALACVVKGYKLICTSNDKQSKEKFDVLRAMGAQVFVCPTNVAPDHPDSYYSVAERLHKETPNSIWCNQYDNLSNRTAHYESTGPEIWEQTEGKITHFVVGVGTGGTISGCAKFLKEKNPNIKIWGIDTYGSVFKKYHETGEFDEKEIYPYITEGIGEDILPKNVDFSLIDKFEKVTDKDGALATRELARKEGLFLGYSCGSAFQGIRQLKDELTEDDVVVVLFHDHGSRYVGKVYNDDWMRDRGFMNDEVKTAKDLIAKHRDLPLMMCYEGEVMENVARKMRQYKISQMPVILEGKMVGSVDDRQLFEAIVDDPKMLLEPVSKVMGAPFPVVDENATIDSISQMIGKDNSAVLVSLEDGGHHIITRHDLIDAIS